MNKLKTTVREALDTNIVKIEFKDSPPTIVTRKKDMVPKEMVLKDDEALDMFSCESKLIQYEDIVEWSVVSAIERDSEILDILWGQQNKSTSTQTN